MIEIMIVISIIGLLLGIAAPQWITARKHTWESAREAGCKRIDDAKTEFVMETGIGGGVIIAEADLAPDYLKEFPTDPNGTYIIGDSSTPCVFVED